MKYQAKMATLNIESYKMAFLIVPKKDHWKGQTQNQHQEVESSYTPTQIKGYVFNIHLQIPMKYYWNIPLSHDV